MTVPELARITDYVAHWAAAEPRREALVCGEERWDYAALEAAVDRQAAALLAAGVGPGDRVAMLGPTHPRSFIVFLATAGVGAIWVGLNPKYQLEELLHVVADAQPRVLFGGAGERPEEVERLARLRETCGCVVVTDGRAIAGLSVSEGEFLEAAAERGGEELVRARAAVSPADPAAMIYTSGTTGKPKGALVPHRGLAFCGTVQAGRWYAEGPPRKLCDLPLNHIGGLGDICTSVLTAGGTIVFMERFDAGGALRLIEAERLTHVYWIPTQLLAVVQALEWSTTDLSSMRWILWGGAAAPLSLLQELAKVGARLGTSYSLTESTGSVTYTDPEDPLHVLSWSVGRIDPHYEVELRRADGRPAEVGEEGELRIRGDFITNGYFGNPEATREAIDAEGWLRTGDLATQDEQGRVRLVGRLKEMFKSGGYNVYPREVEIALEAHPAVRLAAVIGIPDERWGEIGHAFVVADGPVTADELDTLAREKLANYKVPKRIHVEAELPKLPIGKVDKSALRRRAAAVS
jgi:acyl-CoA synthetase (AMP-forming)/AMP-acid ligase II